MDAKKKKKAVFYTATLKLEGLTLQDKVLYSQMLYRSLWDTGETFMTDDGKPDISSLSNDLDGWLPLSPFVKESIYKTINISRAQYYISKKRLRDYGYLTDDGEKIWILDGVENGFFELKTGSGLTGRCLLVYSYISHLAGKYEWVDKYHKSIADNLGMSNLVFANCLTYLCAEPNPYILKKKKGAQVLLKPASRTEKSTDTPSTHTQKASFCGDGRA